MKRRSLLVPGVLVGVAPFHAASFGAHDIEDLPFPFPNRLHVVRLVEGAGVNDAVLIGGATVSFAGAHDRAGKVSGVAVHGYFVIGRGSVVAVRVVVGRLVATKRNAIKKIISSFNVITE